MTVNIGSRALGEGFPCFITFEAGPTHNGLDSAKRLVGLAAEAGADAIKFQIGDPDRLIGDRSVPFTYDVLVDPATNRTETVTEPLYDILCRRRLSREEWTEVKAHADSLGLAFFATPCFEDEVEFLERLRCDSIKISSGDVNHLPLIRRAARTGLSIQLDTGSATIGEVEMAVDVIRSEGNKRIIIHHCPTGYPARLDGVNLNVIPTLKRMFPYPIGFSDHSPGWEMDVAALALGADMVEKTITEDRTTRSIEHMFSLEPPEMKQFVKVVRDLEAAMGASRRIMEPDELKRRLVVRRSAFLAAAAKAGQRLGQLDVVLRRPGYGLSPEMYERLQDAVLRADRPAGHMLQLSDFV